MSNPVPSVSLPASSALAPSSPRPVGPPRSPLRARFWRPVVDFGAATRQTSRMRGLARAALSALAVLCALPARAGDPRAAEGPLDVPIPESAPLATGPSEHVPVDIPEGPAAPAPTPPADAAPAPALPAPTAPLNGARPDALAVAIGLGPSAPGTKAEKQIVDALERSVRAAQEPRANVRRLRAGTGDGRTLCRERRDDLVILVEYLADRSDPVLLPQDCRLDRPLGVRDADAAAYPELVPALWAEHDELLRQGAQERRRLRLSPKVRTGLIVAGAIVAVGVAIGAVVVSTLRRETVVLTVSP